MRFADLVDPRWRDAFRPFGKVPKVNKATQDAPEAAITHVRNGVPRSIRRDASRLEFKAHRKQKKAMARVDRRWRALTAKSTRPIIRLRPSRVMAARAGGTIGGRRITTSPSERAAT